MSKIIGIDIGTNNSRVAVFEKGKTHIINNSLGVDYTPSNFEFRNDGKVCVGEDAKKHSIINAKDAVGCIKKNTEGILITENGVKYDFQNLVYHIIKKLKNDAETYLGYSITDAVISVPGSLSSFQRKNIHIAGEKAGLRIKRMVSGPAATALAYYYNNVDEDSNILIADLGAGTFEVGLFCIGDGVVETLVTSSNIELGGNDFDNLLVDYIIKSFYDDSGILIEDVVAIQRVRMEAEKVKNYLSQNETAYISIPYIYNENDKTYDLEMSITREQFESLATDLLDKIKSIIISTLSETSESFCCSKVILVGGASRIPSVQKLISDITGCSIFKKIDVDKSVVSGLAIQAGKLNGDTGLADILLLDAMGKYLFIENDDLGYYKIESKNTVFPSKISKFIPVNKDVGATIVFNAYEGDGMNDKEKHFLTSFTITDFEYDNEYKNLIELVVSIDINEKISFEADEYRIYKKLNVKNM